MQYLRNHEVAKLYGVSQATVGKWVKATEQGKLSLTLHTQSGKSYIANTLENVHLIEELVEGRKKYRNGKALSPFSGVWRSTYRVPSGQNGQIIEVEHYVVIHQKSSHLVLESLPNVEGSYMMARFTFDGRIATGSYHSENTPKTAAKGATYYGAAQLILDSSGNALRGKGVGFGKDMTVKMSDWELVHIGQKGKQSSGAQSRVNPGDGNPQPQSNSKD
jgi:hypothetical protein